MMNLAESMGIRAILYWVPMYFVFKTLFTIYRESTLTPVWINLSVHASRLKTAASVAERQ